MDPSLWFLLILIASPLCVSSSSSSSSEQVLPRRVQNLDHLDATTLAYYMGIHSSSLEPIEDDDTYVGFDVAVMFYAPWDQNSHTFAPYWNEMGVNWKAGTKESKLVMGLFNCEQNDQHQRLCQKAVNIKQYPTLLFIGSGPYRDSDPVSKVLGEKRFTGPNGRAPIPRTVKFQGNWAYTNSVRDWIVAMRGLSSWHKLSTNGFLRHFRWFNNNKKQKKGANSELPVGISSTGSSGSGSAEVSLLESRLAALGKKVNDTEEAMQTYQEAATHASLLLSNLLFTNGTQDAFATLHENNGWSKDNQDPEMVVLRNCVAELSLDYCTRMSTDITKEYLDSLALMDSENATFDLFEIEAELKKQTSERDTYCGTFDTCLADDFQSDVCRPKTCPYSDSIGCRYMLSCFDVTIKKKYGVALNLIKEGEDWPPKLATTATMTETKQTPDGGGKKSGWFG